MAHSHYVMDTYFPERPGSDRFKRATMRIVADDDAGAVAEGKRIDAWKKSSFFEIRAISTSSRTGDRQLFSSRPAQAVEEPTAIDAAIEQPG